MFCFLRIDIPVIPDLDEIHDDHFTNNEIANASA